MFPVPSKETPPMLRAVCNALADDALPVTLPVNPPTKPPDEVTIPELFICDAVTVFTVTLGVPVNPSALVAVPVKSPTNPPEEVVMPETIALPNTSNFCFGVTEPIPTLAETAVVMPIKFAEASKAR